MKYARLITVATALVGTVAGVQSALAFSAVSTTHLNLRAGPGPQYAVIATINHDDRVDVQGCLKEITWCDVNWGDLQGWAAGEYLAYDSDAGVRVLPLVGDAIEIPVVTYEAVDEVVPQVVGEVVGAKGYVEAISPAEPVSAYVIAQAIDTVYVNGEVVVGAVVPETVPLYAIPESEYTFTSVNGQNVLIDKDTRKVVYIYR
jgi:uncharacterized protein YraI